MIELMILGFLAEGPQHGYELRRKMERLHGHARPISDGTIYPAIRRLATNGHLAENLEDGGGGAPRKMLTLTDAGRAHLEQRLRDADGIDITDSGHFFVILAFLSLVPEPEARQRVLRRRLAFLDAPESFFADGDRPLSAADVDDPYRKGIFMIANASGKAQREWLREMLGEQA